MKLEAAFGPHVRCVLTGLGRQAAEFDRPPGVSYLHLCPNCRNSR